jgi:hypothetical protein
MTTLCKSTSSRVPEWQAPFVKMQPAIVRHARLAFRRLDSAAKEEAVDEVVANAFLAFARLVELNKTDLAFATVLARYGIAQFHDDHRVGSRARICDAPSRRTRERHYSKNRRQYVVTQRFLERKMHARRPMDAGV